MITHDRLDELERNAQDEYSSMTFTHSSEEQLARDSYELTLELISLARVGLKVVEQSRAHKTLAC